MAASCFRQRFDVGKCLEIGPERTAKSLALPLGDKGEARLQALAARVYLGRIVLTSLATRATSASFSSPERKAWLLATVCLL